MTLSYWEKQTYFNNIDLLVIGSGIVGLNAALSFQNKFPKSRVLVAERGFLPNGASTKNAGFCCFGSVSELADDLEHIPEKTVWETVSLRYEGLKKLQQIVGKKAMHYEQSGGFEVFDSKSDFEACADRISAFNKNMKDSIGLKEVYSIDTFKIKESRFSGFRYCIQNQYEGQIDTGQMMRALINQAYQKGICILNNLYVKELEQEKNSVTVIFSEPGLNLKCKNVIIATNGFARQLLPELDVKPARAQVIVTSPIKNLAVKGTFHYQKGYYYFRNIDNRILFGGGRNLDFKGEESTEMNTTPLIQDKLEEILKEKILPGQKFEINHRWSGIMGVGSEKKPIIQSIGKNVVCAVRMGGMGVAIGSLVGDLAVRKLSQ